MTLVDAGPLIAISNARDPDHRRCAESIRQLRTPLITNAAVLAEVMYMLHEIGGWRLQDLLWKRVTSGYLDVAYLTSAHFDRMHVLMEKYKDVPMDFADASLVALAESLGTNRVFSIDSDFYIYRCNDIQPFEVIP